LATLPIWRWVEQENSTRPKAESQKQEEIRCKLQAPNRKLLNTGFTIEKERETRGNLLLMLKIMYYNDKQ
jgi:hypothetical protein